MSKLPLIIKREYFARVRNKSFVVMTFLSPLIMVGMIALITFLTQLNDDTKKVVALVDYTALFISEFESTESTTYINLTEAGLDNAKEIVKKEAYNGLIFIPADAVASNQAFYYGKESPSISFTGEVEKRLESKATDERLIAQGVDLKILADAQSSIDLTIENFDGEKTSKVSNWIKAGFGGAAGYLLMMFIIIYGNMVMRSVIEEKTNRIIEVIISSVKPFQLMMGKILGTTLAGITQFTIWVIIGAVLLSIGAVYFGLDTLNAPLPSAQLAQEVAQDQAMAEVVGQEILRLPLGTLVIAFFIYFIGGFFLYSSFYAAIGAAVDSETDTQQFMLPIIMPLMLAIYVGFFAVISNPHGTVSTVFSIIPLTSPIVMLMRIPFGVPWWELVISISLLIITFTGTVWFGAKIYRVGILMYGKKPSYKELYKWLKY